MNKNLPIELILTSDEEIGGHNGLKALVDNKRINPKIAILPDGLANFNLIVAQKGPIHLFLKAKGKSTHAAFPWRGENAVDRVLDCANKIKKELNLGKSEKEWLPTASLTQISAKSAINQIPDSAEICLDLRITEKEKDQLGKIKNICQKHNCLVKEIKGDGRVFV